MQCISIWAALHGCLLPNMSKLGLVAESIVPNGTCVIYSWCDTGLVELARWFWAWMSWPSGGNCDLGCSLDCLSDVLLPPQVAAERQA